MPLEERFKDVPYIAVASSDIKAFGQVIPAGTPIAEITPRVRLAPSQIYALLHHDRTEMRSPMPPRTPATPATPATPVTLATGDPAKSATSAKPARATEAKPH